MSSDSDVTYDGKRSSSMDFFTHTFLVYTLDF